MAESNNLRVLAMAAAAMVATLAAVAIAVVDTGEARATFRGVNGKIAFDRNGDIWTMDSDGSDQRNLTRAQYDSSYEPAWSPDGTKLALVKTVADRPVGDNFEIFTVNDDGSGARRLTDNASWDDDPAWSPDGTRVAFMRLGAAGWDIWVMDSDGSNQRRLTSTAESDHDPAWSPDGRKIAFSRSATFLYVMNADGTDQRRLSQDGGIGNGPDWSPDGTKLVFSKHRPGDNSDEIGMINADGTGEIFLTDSAEQNYHPAFSPDGQFIAFQSCPVGANRLDTTSCRIRKMRSDGASPVDLTYPPFNEFHREPAWQPLPAFIMSDNALTIRFRDIVLISGRFIYGGADMTSGRKLTLWEQPADSSKDFVPVPGAETTTDKDGFFSFEKVQPQENTNYQVRFAGDHEAGLEAAMSPIKAVNVRVLVSERFSTDALKLGENLTISGTVAPAHEGKVTLIIRRDGKAWAEKSADLVGSRYSFRYKPSATGEYTVIARYPSHEDHLGNTSPKRSFLVR